MADTPTLDEQIAAVRFEVDEVETQLESLRAHFPREVDAAEKHARNLRAARANLEAQKAAPAPNTTVANAFWERQMVSAQTADNEREACVRAVMEKGVYLAPDQRLLLKWLDSTRLALTATQAELAQAREEIARLSEIFEAGNSEDAIKRLTQRLYRIPTETEEDAGAIIDASDALLFQSRKIARLKSPPGADAMEIAKKLRAYQYRRYGWDHWIEFDLNDTEAAHAISAAEVRGRKLLPCPICNGIEGCDHTVPERITVEFPEATAAIEARGAQQMRERAPILSRYHGQRGFEVERFIADYEAWKRSPLDSDAAPDREDGR